MPIPRATKRPLNEYKVLLRIDVDWGSTGIWQIKEPKQRCAGGCVVYEELKLPQWLVDRFEYWTNWHDAHEPWKETPGLDSELWRAYAFSLAIDLKRVLGDDYYVEYGGREIHDDLKYLRQGHRARKRKASRKTL
jgi:hypothetical protein